VQEVRVVEVRPREVRLAEVRPAEVRPAQALRFALLRCARMRFAASLRSASLRFASRRDGRMPGFSSRDAFQASTPCLSRETCSSLSIRNRSEHAARHSAYDELLCPNSEDLKLLCPAPQAASVSWRFTLAAVLLLARRRA
jgi:hypothetical protein